MLPLHSAGVLTAELDGEVVVYDPVTRLVHLPDPVATVVWLACDGATDLATVVAELAGATGAPVEVVERDVAALVDDLRGRGLVGRDVATPAGLGPGPDRAGDLDVHPGSATSRPLRVLDDRLVVHGGDPALVAAVEDLCRGLVVDDGVSPTTGRGVRVDPDGSVALSGALGQPSFPDVGSFLEAFPRELNRLAAASRLGPALHAGAVRSPEGVVVVLPGESEAGKSTLVGTLVQAGWDYLTDEAIGIRPGSLLAVAYPKPLALGPGSRGVLGLPDQAGELVDAARLRPGAAVPPGDVGPVGAVVLTRYSPGAGTEMTPAEPGRGPPRPGRKRPQPARGGRGGPGRPSWTWSAGCRATGSSTVAGLGPVVEVTADRGREGGRVTHSCPATSFPAQGLPMDPGREPPGGRLASTLDGTRPVRAGPSAPVRPGTATTTTSGRGHR